MQAVLIFPSQLPCYANTYSGDSDAANPRDRGANSDLERRAAGRKLDERCLYSRKLIAVRTAECHETRS